MYERYSLENRQERKRETKCNTAKLNQSRRALLLTEIKTAEIFRSSIHQAIVQAIVEMMHAFVL